MEVSPSTGIIFNNEMDDFSLPGVDSFYGVPPSEANFIKPGKRPMSSMTPSVILGADGDVRLVIGASGGTRITSSVGMVGIGVGVDSRRGWKPGCNARFPLPQVALMHLYLGIDLDEAIQTKRFHHQLMPMELKCERGYPEVPSRFYFEFPI